MRDVSFYRDAVAYNKALMDTANKITLDVSDPKVKGWAKFVAKQHREHLRKFRSQLAWAEKKAAESEKVEETAPEDHPIHTEQQVGTEASETTLVVPIEEVAAPEGVGTNPNPGPFVGTEEQHFNQPDQNQAETTIDENTEA